MNSICKYLVLFRQPPETQIYFLIMKIEKGKKNISSWKSQNKREVHFFFHYYYCAVVKLVNLITLRKLKKIWVVDLF